MNKRAIAHTLISLAVAATPAAFAAPSTPNPVAIGGYIVGAIGALLALSFWLQKKAVAATHSDLNERLDQSDKTVGQLQNARVEYERSLAQKDAALAQVQEQRDQAQEMLKTLRYQIERVARIDGLTGVANRQQFGDSLEDEIKRAVRQRKPMSLLFADIDFLEDYIDINGRDKGDHALQRVASCVSETFRRAGDVVARVGPGKFAIILPEADKETGEKFAEKIRRRIYEMCLPFPGSDAADRLTISVGVVTVPPTRLHDRDYVVAMADNALLHAQASGHNRISLSAHAA